MSDSHNHFCIYCGARLIPNQHFCSQCGHEVYHEPEVKVVRNPSRYASRIKEIENDYNAKQASATEMVEKLFDPTHMSYSKFMSAIKKSNQLFSNQVTIARKMVELDESNSLVEAELENKIKTLNAFVDKMEDLINELVIQLSSNKQDNEDLNNLFKDMDDLIDSVKDY